MAANRMPTEADKYFLYFSTNWSFTCRERQDFDELEGKRQGEFPAPRGRGVGARRRDARQLAASPIGEAKV
jgi:hypothetical protein